MSMFRKSLDSGVFTVFVDGIGKSLPGSGALIHASTLFVTRSRD
jgi:hypothetical protein